MTMKMRSDYEFHHFILGIIALPLIGIGFLALALYFSFGWLGKEVESVFKEIKKDYKRRSKKYDDDTNVA